MATTMPDAAATDEQDELDAVDRDALRRSLKACGAEDRGRAEQLESMLEDQPWEEVAQFAAYCCQGDALDLKLWEYPPCHGDVDGSRKEDRLLKRMLAAGVSQWEPDPMTALRRAKRRR